MRDWLDREAPLIATTLAVICFVIFLAFTALRLVEIEQDMGSGPGEDLLWALVQAQFESLRLMTEASIPTASWDEGRLPLQFDLAVSRLTLLSEGTMGQDVAEMGHAQAVADFRAALLSLEPTLRQPGGRNLGALVRETVAPHVAKFRAISNELLLVEREHAREDRARYKRILLEAICGIIGILAIGIFLVSRLLHSLRRAAVAEQNLRHDRDFLNLLLESSGEGVVAFDRDMRCSHWNAGMARIFGRNHDEVIGKRLLEVYPFPPDHAMRKMLERTLGGEDVYMSEHLLPGTGRYLEKLSFPLRYGNEVIGGLIVVRDVTERCLAQRELARHRDELETLVRERTADLATAEAQLRSAVNTAPDGFAAFDATGSLVLTNSRLAELLGEYRALFMPGARLGRLLEQLDVPITPPESFGDKEDVRTGELGLANGVWLLVTLRTSPDGLSVMRFADVTPYKLATQTLETALARETNLRELYKGFVAMVSHQFRTPLAIIDSGAQRMLRRGGEMTAEEIATRAGKIRTAATRLAQLVEGTLNAARFDAGQMDYNPRRCDLRRLVEEACERQRELNPGRRFNLALEGLPLQVTCDPLLIDQVIGNLTSNAAKYSPETEPITIHGESDGRNVLLTVSDRGVGVPSDEAGHLFERFFRASTAAGIPGTGIGLHIAREIARLHGGDLTFASTEGQGTSFTLRLPVVRALERTAR